MESKGRKQITISEKTHSRVKEFCDEYGFKMQGWIDHVLREKLEQYKGLPPFDKLNKQP